MLERQKGLPVPENPKVGDKIKGQGNGNRGEIVGVGKAVVIVRLVSGYTITLLRPIVSHPARNRPYFRMTKEEQPA